MLSSPFSRSCLALPCKLVLWISKGNLSLWQGVSQGSLLPCPAFQIDWVLTTDVKTLHLSQLQLMGWYALKTYMLISATTLRQCSGNHTCPRIFWTKPAWAALHCKGQKCCNVTELSAHLNSSWEGSLRTHNFQMGKWMSNRFKFTPSNFRQLSKVSKCRIT